MKLIKHILTIAFALIDLVVAVLLIINMSYFVPDTAKWLAAGSKIVFAIMAVGALIIIFDEIAHLLRR